MFPDGTLKEAAVCKADLRARIARRRRESVEALTELSRPVEWVDCGLQRWRQVSPWLKMTSLPLGLLVGRTMVSRRRTLGRMVRWLPVAAKLVSAGLALYRSPRRSPAAPQPRVSP
jgi:hypothetical protein